MKTHRSDDAIALKNACIEFVGAYNPTLKDIDAYLDNHITQIEPAYAQAYQPWLSGLRELYNGASLIARGIKMPRPERFLEALKMFSLESSTRFIYDLCKCCDFEMEKSWQEKFLEDIRQINQIAMKNLKIQSMELER